MRRKEAFMRLCIVPCMSVMLCSGPVRSSAKGSDPAILDIGRQFVASGWMGDGEQSTKYIRLIESWRGSPHSEPVCIQIVYSEFSPKGWGGMYWQNKADNWGDKPGEDLSGAGYKSITFWARAEKGDELVEFRAGGIDRENKKYKDSFFATSGKVFLTRQWQKYYIDLREKDLSSVIGGFAWMASQTGNPNGLTFYLDDICFTHEESPKADYLDVGSRFTASGWMGDGQSDKKYIKFEEACKNNPHSGPACIKVSYSEFGSERWGGFYWQNREDNWGDRQGEDLSKAGYKFVTFWVRGDKGDEIVEFKAGGVEAPGKKYKDSFEASIPRVTLTEEWRQHRISLIDKNLSSVIGGFCWVANQPGNPDGLTFYLDDIRFEKE